MRHRDVRGFVRLAASGLTNYSKNFEGTRFLPWLSVLGVVIGLLTIHELCQKVFWPANYDATSVSSKTYLLTHITSSFVNLYKNTTSTAWWYSTLRFKVYLCVLHYVNLRVVFRQSVLLYYNCRLVIRILWWWKFNLSSWSWALAHCIIGSGQVVLVRIPYPH